jgi:hypothetical protein
MWKQTVVATLLIGAPLAANAATMSFTSVRDGPCKSEVHRYCEHAKPGGKRIQNCLREHRTELSKLCARALHRYRNSRNFHLKMRRHTRRDPLLTPKPTHPPKPATPRATKP